MIFPADRTMGPLVFFSSGLIPPIMLELSSVSRIMEGVGCTFVYPWRMKCRSIAELTFLSRCSRLWGFQPRIWNWNNKLVDLLNDLNPRFTRFFLRQLDLL